MAIFSIDIGDEILEEARSVASMQGTSIDTLVREYLESYATSIRQRQVEAMARVLEIARQAKTGSGPEGRTWKREDIYDRPIMRRR